MLYFASFLGGYLVGSIPTAFLIVKLKSGVDIRNAGSGNVGGFNAFIVTSSKQTGYLVGILDGVKGFIAAGVVALLGGSFWLQAAAMSGAIIGHNYSVWLRFKGGRGLATAAGGFFAIGVAYTIVWCTAWFLVYVSTKNILKGNLVAILATPVVLALVPARWVEITMVRSVEVLQFLEFSVVLSAMLLVSHFDVLRSLAAKEEQSASS